MLRAFIKRFQRSGQSASTADEESTVPRGFFAAWFQSRNWMDLTFGIPALLMVACLVAAATASLRHESSAEEFLQLASVARQNGNERLADLFMRRADRLSEGLEPQRFQQAVGLHEDGQAEQALEIMGQLAPDGEPGYRPAHEWMVRLIAEKLAENVTIDSPSESELLERQQLYDQLEAQCTQLLMLDPKNIEVHSRLAGIKLQQGELEDAATHFSHIVERREQTRLVYAKLLARLGRDDEAKRQARYAADYHSRALLRRTADKQYSAQHHVLLADAYVVQGDLQAATETYRQALQLLVVDGQPPESPSQLNLVAEILIRWADALPEDKPRNMLRKMELFDQALQLRPDHPRLVERIVQLTHADGEVGEEAERMLRHLIASGHATWIAHFALGVRALKSGQDRVAETHFELAFEADPRISVTLNNLAHTIAFRADPEPDLPRALQLINQALEIQPQNAEYRDTRAAILIEMERWNEAIVDYEFVLKRIPGRTSTHESLAVAYEAVGDSEMAKIHRDLANSTGEPGEEVSADGDTSPQQDSNTEAGQTVSRGDDEAKRNAASESETGEADKAGPPESDRSSLAEPIDTDDDPISGI